MPTQKDSAPIPCCDCEPLLDLSAAITRIPTTIPVVLCPDPACAQFDSEIERIWHADPE